MSLITRCPACGTMFKVVADQLKISQGWVRCGQCSDVFDAAAHLQPRELDLP
ncbi:MAG: zinc-ribbon domain-containing protein, partial [Polaromonas sp.]|nr:zinc-ribbon domain-containing protein [Polaromonas sp.]